MKTLTSQMKRNAWTSIQLHGTFKHKMTLEYFIVSFVTLYLVMYKNKGHYGIAPDSDFDRNI